MEKLRVWWNDDLFQQKLITALSYLSAIGLGFDGLLNYLDKHTGGFGVLFGFVTCVVNWWYKKSALRREE